MALLGRQASIKVGGTPVAMTDEPLSDLGDELTYQISNTAKQAFDPETAIAVKDGGVDVDESAYTVDYAHGIIVFQSTPVGAATVSGAYVPLLSVAEARGVDTDQTPEKVDVSHFGDLSKRQLYSRHQCSISFEHLHGNSEDLDAGAGSFKLGETIGSTIFVEVNDGSEKLRGWFLLESQKTAISLADAIGKTAQATGVVRDCASAVGGKRSEQALFSWR